MTKASVACIVCLLTFTSVTWGMMQFTPSAKKVVFLSEELQKVTHKLEDIANDFGYPNTERGLEQIDGLAEDVESATRRKDLAGAQSAMNDLVDEVIDIRRFVNNIPDVNNKRTVRRRLNRAVNDLGFALFGPGNWIAVRAVAAPNGGPVDQEAVEQREFDAIRHGNVSGGEFADDLGGAGGGDAGGGGGFGN